MACNFVKFGVPRPVTCVQVAQYAISDQLWLGRRYADA